MTFRISIDPKPLCAWGVGRGHFTIYDLQLLSHPTEQTLLYVVYNNYQGMSGVISNRARHKQESWCASVSLSLGPSAMLSLQSSSHQWCGVAKQHLSCPSTGRAHGSVAAQALKKRGCCAE